MTAEDRNSFAADLLRGAAGRWRPSSVTAEDRNGSPGIGCIGACRWRPSSVTAADRNLTPLSNHKVLTRWRPSSVTAEDRNSFAADLLRGAAGRWRPSSVTAEDRNAWPRSSWFRGLPRGGRPP